MQRAVLRKLTPCGENVGPRVGSAEWQVRQLSSRWHEAQARILRWADTAWLFGRGVEITAPPASRAHPGGWNVFTPVPPPNGLFARRPGSPPSGSAPTPVRWWQPTQNDCVRWHDEQSGVLRRASTACSET